MICQHTKIETRVRADTGAPCGLWACADCGVRFEPPAPPTPTIDVERLAKTPIEAEVKRLLSDGKDTAHMTPDQRHEFIVRQFPDGLTGVQFAALTLLSAGEDGIVDPPSVGDFFQRQSLIFGLWVVEGLIERKCKRDEAGPYYLTKRARELLEALRALAAGVR